MADSLKNRLERQRTFFSILNDFFVRLTGRPADQYFDFNEVIRNNEERLASRTKEAYSQLFEEMSSFYNSGMTETFGDAKNAAGLKLLVGGGSRFTSSHLDGVRKMLLYSDTVLIPDPILPWIETERTEERFPIPQLLYNAYTLLQLKPLVDADLPYPAILVFQSWEKSLEKRDPYTKEGIDKLVDDFFRFFLHREFEGTDILEFVDDNAAEFMLEVEERNLFVAPGSEPGQPVQDGIRQYLEEIATWRSAELASASKRLSQSRLVFNGIVERVAPLYHLLENVTELSAQPLFSIKAHWHYWKLVCQMYEGRLLGEELISLETVNTVHALAAPDFGWLGAVPIQALVGMREQNENVNFRKKLSEYTTALRDSNLGSTDKAVAEVGRGLAILIKEHQREIDGILEKYSRRYANILTAACVTLAAGFVPALAPFIGPIAPVALAGQYLRDKREERAELKQASKSVFGILASATKH